MEHEFDTEVNQLASGYQVDPAEWEENKRPCSSVGGLVLRVNSLRKKNTEKL